MFNSKMYKKYYPIKSSFDIANMNVAEQKKLIYWSSRCQKILDYII